LRGIATTARQGLPLIPEDADWFASAIDAVLAGRARSLDAELGLKANGKSWRRVEARRSRDDKIFVVARRSCPNKSAAEAATEIAAVFKRYASTAWLNDRQNGVPHKRNEHLYEIFREAEERVSVPTSGKQIHRILEDRGWTTASPVIVRSAVRKSDSPRESRSQR
jgi:hypothetical protein